MQTRRSWRETVGWALVLAVLAALCLVTAATCDSPSRLSPPADNPSQDLSEPLLIALAQAKNEHHLADVHLADGNTEAAIQDVTRILSIQFPPGAPEGEDTLLDARARLGKLYLGAGRLAEGERVVDEGVAGAKRDSFFLANLYTVQGELRHARGLTLQGEARTQALHSAIESFRRSQQINNKLQQQLYQETRP